MGTLLGRLLGKYLTAVEAAGNSRRARVEGLLRVPVSQSTHHRLAAAPEDGGALGRVRRGSAVFISVPAVCRPPHDSTPGR